MNWVGYAALTALFKSFEDLFNKKSVQTVDEYVAAWALRAFSLPLLLLMALALPHPPLDGTFWAVLVVGGALNVLTTVLYAKALKHADLSLVTPLTAFTPLLLLATSPLIVGEFPRARGLAGMLLVVAGSYVLNRDGAAGDFWEPFRGLWRSRGARSMMAVAVIWSVTANIDKIGVRHSSPFAWVLWTNVLIAAVLTPVMLARSGGAVGQVRGHWRVLLALGTVSGVALLCQMAAVRTGLVPYVISIKRVSALLSVLWGGWVFRERIRGRLAGAALMLAGVFLMVSA